MKNQGGLGQWLEKKCRAQHLSLRQAGIKTGVSHATIADIFKGTQPLPKTIQKLAIAFGEVGNNDRQELENQLFVLAGYRTPQPEEELSEPVTQLMNKVNKFSEPQIKMMTRFADFLMEVEKFKSNLAH